MKTKQPDWDELAAHNAGSGECFPCFFCDCETNGEYGGAPEGSSQTIRDMYMQRPRCMSCDIDIRLRLNAAMIKGIESVFSGVGVDLASGPDRTIFTLVERSDEEKTALDEIYREQDQQALSELDIDRLAQEHGDGRFYP